MRMSLRARYAVLAVIGLFLVAGAVWNERARDDQRPGTRVASRELGPTSPDTESYAARKKEALSRLARARPDSTAAALVSFARRLTPAETTALIGGFTARAVFLSRPGAGEQAVAVDGSIEEAVSMRVPEDPACACLYAVVLEGASLHSLGSLAARPEVRLVDVPIPLVRRLDGWELRPLLPPS